MPTATTDPAPSPSERRDARLGTPSPDHPGGSEWLACPAEEVAAALGVQPTVGLDPAEARRRLAVHGANRLVAAPSRPRWLLFLDQFRNRLILILVGAAVVAWAVTGTVKDPIVIGIVVLLNAILGFVQESRAERSLAALEQMLVTTARVRRGGRAAEVPAEEVVPGDVVLVEAGDRVPADGRWLVAVDLEVDEAPFTGESVPVAKTDAPLAPRPPGAARVPVAEQRSMGFMQTTVTRGRGELLVTATGMGTEIGALAGLLRAAESGPSPLQRQIHDLGTRLTLVAGAAVLAVLLVGVARGEPLADNLLNAVALAVAAIPEGLPAVLTVTLAVGSHQLAKRHAIVKRLASVETLGSTTVICSDKTGTLTLNQMTARALWARGRRYRVTGEGYRTAGEIVAADGPAEPGALRRALLPLALANESRVHDGVLVGDPTEGAVLVLAAKGGIDADGEAGALPRVAEVPFDSARKYHATFHRAAEGLLVLVKGAPDVLLPHCSRLAAAAGDVPMDDAARAELTRENEVLAADGLRVLAGASRVLPADALDGVDDPSTLVEELTLEALVGILDPPRPAARDAIARCRQAGIRVAMITGDHASTATAIGRSLGIEGDTVTGAQLERMDDGELAARVEHVGVFARVAPEHKVRIVRALRANGEVVAMTGDGVNDAPALKTADIGVAMGITGTEVTKEAATMVLTDDDFATIVEAVRGGRAIYDNIVKFVRFQLSTNLGAILTILTASLLAIPAGGGAFFTPVAILWVNLIMDGPPAIALGVDPPGPGSMDRPPRDPAARILSGRRLRHLLGFGAVMAAGTLAVHLYATGGTGSVSDLTAARAATMAFTTFVLFQMFNLFNVRFEDESALGRHSTTNGRLWASLAAVVVLQVVVVEWGPAQQLFTGADVTAHLSALDWLVVVAVAASVLVVEELRKAARREWRARRREPTAAPAEAHDGA